MARDTIRNVLLIAADQWRAECLSALGHPCVRTPNLDALAADGVLFHNHYTQCSPCGPARASLLTGLYLQNHRMVRNGTPLDRRFTNVAKEARRAGYEPILMGYTDTAPDPRDHDARDPELTTYERPMAGFTPHLVMGPDFLPWRSYLAAKGYDVPADPYGIYAPVSDYAGTDLRGPTFAPPRYKAADSDTAFQTDALIDYLRVRGDKPWFIHTAYLRPHWPFVAPEPFNRAIDPDAVPTPARAATVAAEAAQHPLLAYLVGHHNVREGRHYIKDYTSGSDLTDRHHRQLMATYFGLMVEFDHHVGRIVAFLKAHGLYDNTLVIFTCDHGENGGDHWLCGKEGYFDPAFHIPLIVRDPRAVADGARGSRVERFTEAIDIMPTILEALGLPIPRQCDGRSLLPFLRGSVPTDWRTEVHWEFDFRNARNTSLEGSLHIAMDACNLGVIRDRRRKYVHFPNLPPLFFDLEQDPNQFHNLAADVSRASEVLDYAQRMISWRMLNDERTLTGMHLGEGGVHARNR